ncbi:uncharacterized protein [Montipora capricornis]|uniref:uncharacterized protein n=1 Tax=Montipora capricornis TaxID=246305 RepID=UPI0035F10C4F
MPGDKCSVFGWGSCSRTKGIRIWKEPLAKDEAHRRWREEWLGEIKKTRDMDADFREQIKKDRVYTCEKHVAPEDIEIYYAIHIHLHIAVQMSFYLTTVSGMILQTNEAYRTNAFHFAGPHFVGPCKKEGQGRPR